jgi:HEPN domain-containing protein/predicted nucleotidyltransferase
MKVEESLLEELVRRILAVTRPDKIILFGSAATGQMTADSDIDLLIVLPTATKSREIAAAIRSAIGSVPNAVDVHVIGAERFEATKTVVGGIAYPAHKYGRVLYQRTRYEARLVVADWIARAEGEWGTAGVLSRDANLRYCVAFYAYLAVEKYLEALLTWHQIEFPKPESIGQLLKLLEPADPDLARALEEADWLSQFWSEYDHPGDRAEALPGDEARAMLLAGLVREHVMALLGPYLAGD